MPKVPTKEVIRLNVDRLMKRDNLNGVLMASMLDEAPGSVSRWLNGKIGITSAILDKMRDRLGWGLKEMYWQPESDEDEPPPGTKDLDRAEAVRIVADACGFERPRLKKKSQ
jgi:hypothetical protein